MIWRQTTSRMRLRRFPRAGSFGVAPNRGLSTGQCGIPPAHQSGVAGSNTQESPDPSSAAMAVNAGARELGSLVMLRGIDSAQEVYAREARMLAQVQASLRWRAVQSKSPDVRSIHYQGTRRTGSMDSAPDYRSSKRDAL